MNIKLLCIVVLNSQEMIMCDLQSRYWMKFYGCTAHQDCPGQNDDWLREMT